MAIPIKNLVSKGREIFRVQERPVRKRVKFAVAAIMKNEGPYILEWIALHRVLGAEHFFLADNGSDDGAQELLAELSNLGIIDFFVFKNKAKRPPQLPAYAEILRRYGASADWLAFIDLDEFFIPDQKDEKIGALLDTMAENVGAVAVNWAAYGSSHRNVPSKGLVVERFVQRSKEDLLTNNHYKTILRTNAVAKVGGTPHKFRLKRGFHYVHADKSPLVDHKLRGEGLSHKTVWAPLRLNHYVVKSKAEFDNKKRPRGRASRPEMRDQNFFANYDRNDVHDPAATWLVEATRQEMDRLRQALREAGCDEKLVYLDEAIANLTPISPTSSREKGKGRIESISVENGVLKLRGWAVNLAGESQNSFAIELAGRNIQGYSIERYPRHDVARRFPGKTVNSGLLICIPLDRLEYDRSSPPTLMITSPDGGFSLINSEKAVWPPQLLR
ncbi:glycosyltransferase family 2 protein [Corticibacterium sp. UT-5YL-CI-8]|nr:glycosyltransferase family 2 protein [Tianweitania sp. UT-5YL-CI-8]